MTTWTTFGGPGVGGCSAHEVTSEEGLLDVGVPEAVTVSARTAGVGRTKGEVRKVVGREGERMPDEGPKLMTD